MALVLSQPEISRTDIGQSTGLSRSTVSRVVDELLEAGFVEQVDRPGPVLPGRPSRLLRAATARGQVIGIDVGVTTARLISADLNGRVLHQDKEETPAAAPAAQIADWLAELIDSVSRLTPRSPLRRVVMSFPAKIEAEVNIKHAAKSLSHLEGVAVYAHLSRRLSVPLLFRSDPDMALRGEMCAGRAVNETNVVLFVVSAALQASIVVEGTQLGGDRGVIGEFGRMPFAADGLTLDDVLSIDGVSSRSVELGYPVRAVQQLIDERTHPVVAQIRDDLQAGMVQMLVAVTLSIEPRLIVFAGRMLPVLADLLPGVAADLDAILPVRPRIALSESRGYSQPLGAVQVALEAERPLVLDEVAMALEDQQR